MKKSLLYLVLTLLFKPALNAKSAISTKKLSEQQIKSVTNFHYFYDEFGDLLGETDLQHLALRFDSVLDNLSDAKAIYDRYEKCRFSKNYHPATAKQIANLIMTDVYEGLKQLEFQDVAPETLNQFRMDIIEIGQIFEDRFSTTSLSVCVQDYLPDYSDGHRDTLVRFNGQLIFAFSHGRPD